MHLTINHALDCVVSRLKFHVTGHVSLVPPGRCDECPQLGSLHFLPGQLLYTLSTYGGLRDRFNSELISGCNTDSVLPIEVLQKASRRRKQTDVLAWCADVDAKGLERLREIHLEMLVEWKLKEQPERHSFRPYLGEIENDYSPDQDFRSPGKASVDRGLSILKRTLLISDAVAIADL